MVVQAIPTKTVFDIITDFLAMNPTPQEILDFKLPDDLQIRASELLDRNGEDLLTYDEELEMMDFVRANDMMSLLKAKTRQKMAD